MDVFLGLLPFAPGVPFLLALIVVYRLWFASVKELREERKDHSLTQKELDAERDSRRRVEDEVSKLSREINGMKSLNEMQIMEIQKLKYEVNQLRLQLGEAA